MTRIIDGRGTGKTSELMSLAKDNNATFVCSNPYAMKYKADKYGVKGISFISYDEFSTVLNNKEKYVIDELENFMKAVFGSNFIGYTIS